MTTNEKNPSEAILQKALADLAIESIPPAIFSYLNRSALQAVIVTDDISEDELAQIQLILIQEAARDVGLDFNMEARKNITKFKEQLREAIFTKAKIAEDTLREHVCVELNYCEKVGNNWRGKLLFGSGLALAALLADLTGISLAGVLYLLSTGYFDELCECNKVKVVGL